MLELELELEVEEEVEEELELVVELLVDEELLLVELLVQVVPQQLAELELLVVADVPAKTSVAKPRAKTAAVAYFMLSY